MKKIRLILCTLVILLVITGCSMSKAAIYKVSTGDTIKIEVETTNGYKLSSTLPFEIKKDDVLQTSGEFITIDGYNEYLQLANSDTSTILDRGNTNGMEYTFYSYNSQEFNYIIKVTDKTGILLKNTVSKESAEECFNRFNVSIEE